MTFTRSVDPFVRLKTPKAQEVGLEYELLTCLAYNGQEFEIDDIVKVLAISEGARDGDAWGWLLQLTDGRIAYLQGGCDYTGWDCQSWADAWFYSTPEEAIASIWNPPIRLSISEQWENGEVAKTYRQLHPLPDFLEGMTTALVLVPPQPCVALMKTTP